jgi:mono/diheme cytochrome c family protein
MVAVLAVALVGLSSCSPPAPAATETSAPASPATVRDRLAAPELPENPSQADLGSHTYWANCMACHGDRGQGLTEEFRTLYPPEDRNCWESGCHGPRPYENGFTLPAAVPALFGVGRLSRFGDAARLQAFVSAAMPWHDPGSLSQEEYWQVTAFLLRENGADPGSTSLGPDNAGGFPLPPAPEPTSAPSAPQAGGRYPVAAVVVGVLLMVAVWLRMERLRGKPGPKK